MIIPRISHFSNLNTNGKMITRLTEKLDRDHVEDYEVTDRIPKDVISVTADPTSLKIYIPRDYEYSQFGIDDFIRSQVSHIRTTVTLDRNIYVMKLSGSLTFDQYYKLVRYIIDEEEFCSILE